MKWYMTTMARQDNDGKLVEYQTIVGGHPAIEMAHRAQAYRETRRANEIWHLISWIELNKKQALAWCPEMASEFE